MPLFAYVCKRCGAEVELLAKRDDKVACPTCGSTHMEKQLSRFSPLSSQTISEPACSSCAMASNGRCPSQSGCMP